MPRLIKALGEKLGVLALLGALALVAVLATGLPRHERADAALPHAAASQRLGAVASASVPAHADQRFVIKHVLEVPVPFRHGDYVWDDSGAPAGPIIITVDLAAQTLSVFRGGYEIGAAVILYGGNDKPTPLGTFAITQKDAKHVSTIYDVPMPYMLRLTNDGVSIHGSDVKWNVGTSGCIGVPVPFAKLLFGQAKLGDRVLITNGKTLHLGEPITRS